MGTATSAFRSTNSPLFMRSTSIAAASVLSSRICRWFIYFRSLHLALLRVGWLGLGRDAWFEDFRYLTQ